ncbi:MAG TPA: cysteine desulfurase [Candidatus Kapabacteria bacterium]|nr:cysteine desulfurase [Candidatus Kapabacteria bacterium]
MNTTSVTDAGATALDIEAIRAEFPVLDQQVRGRQLVYLDNAATTQKPRQVVEEIARYYYEDNANVHRGVHTLSQRATKSFDAVRRKVREFVNAADEREIIFVRGATEAINLVAQSYGRSFIGAGDEIVISEMEHHSDIVPWQMVCEQTGATLRTIPFNDRGELRLDVLAGMLSERTKLVACVHVSNALGTINPIKEIAAMAHAHGAVMLVDGAQAAPHLRIDVQDLGCDFYTISSHKMYGPTGIGALYGRRELLEKMPPYQGGGDMIASVTFEKTEYNVLPYKFEAGTPNIEGVIAFGAAIDFFERIGIERIAAHEADLLAYATEKISQIPGVTIIGRAANKASVLSFVLEGVHAHDIGTILDFDGIAIRAGHHCAQPVMQCYGIAATARASFAIYNTRQEVDALVAALAKVKEVFG